MEDGDEYVSSVVTMPVRPNVDSLYAEPGTKIESGYTQYDEPYSATRGGYIYYPA